ncbi:hypothetical protein Tco_0668909 [Tanacetum coccineum]
MYKTSTSNQHEDGILEQVKRRHRGNEFRPHNVDINGHVNSTKVDTGSSDFERVMRKKATSFFFTNFLDSWDSKALWKMVGRYRIVVDVYVAFKKTKLNTRFGFVRPSNFIELALQHRPSPNSTKVNELEEDASLKARLVWINFEGIPLVARNQKSIFTIASSFRDVLEVIKFDFNSEILQPGKALIYSQNLNEIKCVLKSSLNGRLVDVKVFEDRFSLSLLLKSHCEETNKWVSDSQFSFDKDEPFVEDTFSGGGFGKGRTTDGSLSQDSCDSNCGPVNNSNGDNDNKLDELLSSFQKISEEVDVNTKIKGYKRKNKGKKKRLVVGGNNCYSLIHSSNSIDDLDEANTMMNINKKRLVK